MKPLVDAFLDLPTSTGVLLIVGAGVVVTIIALIVSRVSFHAGRRHAERRLLNLRDSRRHIASIR